METARNGLFQLRSRTHQNCVVCSSSNERSLHVNFVALSRDEVRAQFDCLEVYEGYTGTLHGGVAASLIDGAMTNCMFAHGVLAVTAELTVRYRQPVLTGKNATVRAWIERSMPRLYLVRAEIVQDGKAKVTGSGKFVRRACLPDGEVREG